jgi:hypothetical protein
LIENFVVKSEVSLIYTGIYNKYWSDCSMVNFEALQSIDNFCRVLVKKTASDEPERSAKGENAPSADAFSERIRSYVPLEAGSVAAYGTQTEVEEPLVDVFDEEEYVRILVQCRCREQEVTFHPSADGITVCKEECHREKGGPETCRPICRKLSIRTDELQLDNMLSVVAKCNNNNTLEAMIPKIRK